MAYATSEKSSAEIVALTNQRRPLLTQHRNDAWKLEIPN